MNIFFLSKTCEGISGRNNYFPSMFGVIIPGVSIYSLHLICARLHSPQTEVCPSHAIKARKFLLNFFSLNERHKFFVHGTLQNLLKFQVRSSG